MSRLTARDENSKTAYYPKCFDEPCLGGGCEIPNCKLGFDICEKLAKYEEAEEAKAHKMHRR